MKGRNRSRGAPWPYWESGTFQFCDSSNFPSLAGAGAALGTAEGQPEGGVAVAAAPLSQPGAGCREQWAHSHRSCSSWQTPWPCGGYRALALTASPMLISGIAGLQKGEMMTDLPILVTTEACKPHFGGYCNLVPYGAEEGKELQEER